MREPLTEIFGSEVDPADVCRAQIAFDVPVADHLARGRNPPVGGRAKVIAPVLHDMAWERVTVMRLVVRSIERPEI